MTKDGEIKNQCAFCHITTLPEYYFCPNCGKELKAKPLPTSVFFQIKLYTHSAILPCICFITISKWKGIAYIKENNKTANIIGYASLFILTASTLFTFWCVYITTIRVIEEMNKEVGNLMQGL